MSMQVVSYSGGLGSFMAAKLTVDRFGPAATKLVFTDTKTEDEDLYRFLRETANWLGVELVTLADGRDIWQVFEDEKFMGNSRIDPCSKILKRELFKRWIAKHHLPTACTIVFGIDHRERHRLTTIQKRWEPYLCAAPLCELELTREDILDVLDKAGIKPPRLYEMGFPHNNCGGFCVKTGQKQMLLLLKQMPERYLWHEDRQEKLFSLIGQHGFIRRVRQGKIEYLSLKQFRELVERGDNPDLYEESGCGCFI